MIRATWPLPAIIAAASLFGLFVALTGDGPADAVASIALAAPVAAALWALCVKRG